MKILIIVSLFYFFSLSFNINNNENFDIIEFFNLLFLNRGSDLSPNSDIQGGIEYIVGFYFLFSLYMHYILSNLSESISFSKMLIYRKGKANTLRMTMLSSFKKVLISFFITILTIIIVPMIIGGINVFTSLFNIIIVIYLIKFFIVLMFFAILHNYFSLVGNFNKVNLLIISIYVSLILIDINIGIHFITFSSNFLTEIISLTIISIIFSLSYFYILRDFKRKSDIL